MKQRRRKLLLIHAVSPASRYIMPESRRPVIPPLWPSVLAGLTPKDRWSIEFIDESVEPCRRLQQADLVGISALSVNAGRAYQLAHAYRKAGIPVIMGGWHVSVLPQEALRFCDAVVIGEAEPVWPEVLDDFCSGRLKETYHRFRPELREEYMRPDRSVLPRRYLADSVQFARGCSLNCDFCSIKAVYGPGVRYWSPERVIDDVESCRSRYIFFADENFTGNSPTEHERAIELLKEWDRRKIRKKWMTFTSLTAAENDEMLYWMKKTDCLMILAGFEDVNASNLNRLNKRLNAKLDYRRCVERLHAHDVGIVGAFIVGHPGQTADDVRAIMDFVTQSCIDYPQFAMAGVLPGCKWWDENKDKVPYQNFPDAYGILCSFFIPTLPETIITRGEWKQLYDHAWRRMLSRREIFRRFRFWVGKGRISRAFMIMGMAFGARETYRRLSRIEKIFDHETGAWKLSLKDGIPPLPEDLRFSYAAGEGNEVVGEVEVTGRSGIGSG